MPLGAADKNSSKRRTLVKWKVGADLIGEDVQDIPERIRLRLNSGTGTSAIDRRTKRRKLKLPPNASRKEASSLSRERVDAVIVGRPGT